MSGWIALGAGLLTLFQVWWYEPRGMVRTRVRISQRGDPSKFDTFLASKWYRRSRRARVGAGVAAIVLGVLLIGGLW